MRLNFSVVQVLLISGVLLSGCVGNAAPSRQQAEAFKTHAPLANTSNIVFILPVDGVAGSAKMILADALAASLRDAARPAVISQTANTLGPTIVGRISEIRKRDTIAWVTASWELRAPYGGTVAQVSHEVIVDRLLWKEAGVEAVNLVIAEAEPHIIGMVADHVGPLTATQDVAMPPSERMPVASGSSQSFEQITPAPTAGVRQQTLLPPVSSPTAAPRAADQDVGETEMGLPSELMDPMPDTPDLNALTAQDVVAAPDDDRLPAAPVRLVPGSAGPGEAEVEDPLLERMMESDPAVNPGADPSMPVDADTEARALTDKLLEMADIPKEDPVPDNTKLKPVVWAQSSFLVKIVAGAPGDGNERLTSSLKKALRDKDMTVTEDPRQAAYEIKGRVVVGPPVNGRQQARIVWRVNTVSGDEVGQAVQENAVIAGSLDGEWGRVAEIVSNAAVDGIQELFDGEGRRRQRTQTAPEFPDVGPLPQVPGRAPPPNQ
jgi:hypothetical protein